MQNSAQNKLRGFWEVVDYDNELAVEIATIFCETVRPFVAEIRQNFESNQLNLFTLNMHKLKGTIGYVGFDETFGYISALERTAKLNKRLPSHDELASMESQIDDIIQLFSSNVLSHQMTF